MPLQSSSPPPRIRGVTETDSKSTRPGDFEDFMRKHIIKKEDKDKFVSTNTRIGDVESRIFGGSYHIDDDEYNQFLDLYYEQIILKKKDEYLMIYVVLLKHTHRYLIFW